MNKAKVDIKIIAFVLAIGLLFFGFYTLYIRPLVFEIYQGKEVFLLDWVIRHFYPRFEIERHRLPLEFFLSKCDQIVWRTIIVGSLIVGFYTILEKNILERPPISFKDLQIMKILLVGFSGFYFYDNIQTLVTLGMFPSFYKPIGWLAFLFPVFPSEPVIYGLQIILWISWLWALISPNPALALATFLIDFIVIQGFFISFQKVDHGFATFFIALGGITGVYLFSSKNETMPSWPLVLAQFCICLVYAMAGMEKLTISGSHWFESSTMQHHLLAHHQPLGILLADFPWICSLFSFGAIVFQLGFLAVFFFPRFTLYWVLFGMCFHGISGLVFQVAGIFSPWILAYVIFIPWERWRIFSIQKLFKQR